MLEKSSEYFLKQHCMLVLGKSSENIHTSKLLISIKVRWGEKLAAKYWAVHSLKFSQTVVEFFQG